jgi:hypothetical protein
LVIVDVPGQTPGPVPDLQSSLEVEGNKTATYNFTPPTAGWPAGKYKVEVVMVTDQGEQKDQKSANFSVQ